MKDRYGLMFVFLGVVLGVFLMGMVGLWDKQQAVRQLTAERDSLVGELRKGDPDCSKWVEKIVVRGLRWKDPFEIKDGRVSFPLYYDILVYSANPDTLPAPVLRGKTKPMKR